MKVGISLKESVVEKIDKKAEEMGVSRSAYISMAIAEKMKQDDVVESLPEMLASMRKMADKEWKQQKIFIDKNCNNE